MILNGRYRRFTDYFLKTDDFYYCIQRVSYKDWMSCIKYLEDNNLMDKYLPIIGEITTIIYKLDTPVEILSVNLVYYVLKQMLDDGVELPQELIDTLIKYDKITQEFTYKDNDKYQDWN